MNQNQNTGAYTAADPNEHFFFLIDALKRNAYSEQVVTALMDEFLKRGMYHEFLQLTALRAEFEHRKREERQQQEAEARDKRESRSFMNTLILTILCSGFLMVRTTNSILGLVCVVLSLLSLIGWYRLIRKAFNALLRAGRY